MIKIILILIIKFISRQILHVLTSILLVDSPNVGCCFSLLNYETLFYANCNRTVLNLAADRQFSISNKQSKFIASIVFDDLSNLFNNKINYSALLRNVNNFKQ